MKRLLSTLFTAVTVSVAVVVLVAVLRAWFTTDDFSFDSQDARSVIQVKQPPAVKWKRPLDNSGYDVSFPQCGQSLSQATVGFAIIGVNHGRPLTQNPCFATQWQWAQRYDGVAVYVNMSDPGTGTAIQRGKKIVDDLAWRLPSLQIPTGTPVWLDIERDNSWTSTDRSVKVIQTVAEGLAAIGYPVGVYSTPVHWLQITFSTRVELPVWVALGYFSSTAAGVQAAKAACDNVAFGEQKPAIVQFVSSNGGPRRDRNIMCAKPDGLVAPH